MSSKVIKWFKRQASIRRHSDKSDDKASSNSPNNSEEKRKTSFPRLSFRRRNKKKTASASEAEGSLSIVGISKKFSRSVPQHMESGSKEKMAATRMPTSYSESLDSSSLTNSPTKTDGYRSTSDMSYHSSSEFSKETNESLSLGGKETTIAEVMETKETDENASQVTKLSDYDNNQQTFQNSVNNYVDSPSKDDSVTGYPKHDSSTDSNEVRLYENAPIVRMEEICDIISDKEHPDEIETGNVSNDSTKYIDDEASTESSVCVDTIKMNAELTEIDMNSNSNKTEDEILFITEEESNTENVVAVNSELEIKNECNPEIEEETSATKKSDAFEEIDIIVRETNSLIKEADDETKNCDTENKEENNDDVVELNTNNEHIAADIPEDSENKRVELQISEICDKIGANFSDNAVDITTNECNENIEENLNTEIDEIHNEVPLETIESKEYAPDIIAESNAIIQSIKTHYKPEVDLNLDLKPEINISSDHRNSHSTFKKEAPVKIVITHPSPVKHDSNVALKASVSKQSLFNEYPEELNPFGEEEEDSDENKINERINNVKEYNKNVIVNKENGANHFKENGSSSFKGHTTEFRADNNSRSLNPFGDSDEEDDGATSSLNRLPYFTPQEQQERQRKYSVETPPRLPPKTAERHRKNSHGSLAPIPRPRKSKQSHHGSYTSLQNVPVYPIPAPRSITPFGGSTKTLNESTNPFGDDDDDATTEFDRRGLGRCSVQMESSHVGPFGRSVVRGSLPPALRHRNGRKKRQAPLPPGYTPNKPAQGALFDPKMLFTSLPRQRSSTSPASDFQGGFQRRSPSGREISPHRHPPPRPPPPKI